MNCVSRGRGLGWAPMLRALQLSAGAESRRGGRSRRGRGAGPLCPCGRSSPGASLAVGFLKVAEGGSGGLWNRTDTDADLGALSDLRRALTLSVSEGATFQGCGKG